jgi:transcription elongation factor Elf1
MAKRYANGEENEHIVTDQLANMFHCPECGFEYHAQHTEDGEKGGYICPLCESVEQEEENNKFKNYIKHMNDVIEDNKLSNEELLDELVATVLKMK